MGQMGKERRGIEPIWFGGGRRGMRVEGSLPMAAVAVVSVPAGASPFAMLVRADEGRSK
jgi:hypothetical protein